MKPQSGDLIVVYDCGRNTFGPFIFICYTGIRIVCEDGGLQEINVIHNDNLINFDVFSSDKIEIISSLESAL